MDAALVLARFVHFAALMSLFGALAYGGAPTRRTAATLAALALASALAWGVVVTRNLAGTLDADALEAVFAGTSFGAVWLVRLALLAVLLGLARRPSGRALTLAAGAALASLAWVGHAAMQAGALGLAHRLNHAAHLLLAGFWLGGLPPFLASLAAFATPSRRAPALASMMRFSRFGHFAVAGLFVSGAADVALTTGALPWPPETPYRLGLVSKIFVFLAMTMLALGNRYVLAPRIGRSGAARKALFAGAVAELGLAFVAVALVSGFATYDPS